MILPGDTEFPNNVIALMAARIKSYCDPTGTPGNELLVYKRMLRPTDGTQCVGVFPSMKRPDPTSHESGATQESTLKRYTVILQTMVQDSNEEDCIAVHSILSNRLWRMVYRDSPLNAGLTALAVDADNSRERLQRRGVEHQRYIDNEISGTFIQTSWIECWFETETVETT